MQAQDEARSDEAELGYKFVRAPIDGVIGDLVVATVLSLGVVPPVYVLVKNLENRRYARQDAPTQQANA